MHIVLAQIFCKNQTLVQSLLFTQCAHLCMYMYYVYEPIRRKEYKKKVFFSLEKV